MTIHSVTIQSLEEDCGASNLSLIFLLSHGLQDLAVSLCALIPKQNYDTTQILASPSLSFGFPYNKGMESYSDLHEDCSNHLVRFIQWLTLFHLLHFIEQACQKGSERTSTGLRKSFIFASIHSSVFFHPTGAENCFDLHQNYSHCIALIQ